MKSQGRWRAPRVNLHGRPLLLPDATQVLLRVLQHCNVWEAARTGAGQALQRARLGGAPPLDPMDVWVLETLVAGGVAEAQTLRSPLLTPPVVCKREAAAEATPSLGCCPECRHVRLDSPNQSDLGEKDRQRAHMDAALAQTAAAAMDEEILNALVVDAPLRGRLFCAALASAGHLRGGVDGAGVGGRWRVLAPNLDPSVVRALAGLGLPAAALLPGEGCVCNVLRHYEPLLARSGGLAVLFLDVHGAFRNGAATMLRWLVERCLFRCTTTQPAVVGFAVSCLPDVFSCGGRDAAVAWLRETVGRLFDAHTHYEACFPEHLGDHGANLHAYSRTMVYCVLHVLRRPAEAAGVLVPGFHEQRLLVEHA